MRKSSRLLAISGTVLFVSFVAAPVADAATPSQNFLSTFNVGGIISLLVGTVLPLAVNFFTKANINQGVKAIILAFLSGVSAVLGQWLDAINNDTPFIWEAAVLSALLTFGIAILSVFGLWKPGGTQGLYHKSTVSGVGARRVA